jgi:hypothetical protein
MPRIDQARATSPTWTGDRVRARLVEAFKVERRMPGARFTAIASAWPATPLYTFAEAVGWGSLGSERVLDDWEQAKGTLPYEVSMMEETFDWLRYLPDGERRCLSIWAVSEARGFNITAIIDRRKWKRTTFYRKRDAGAARIAERLNAQGVVVR